MPDVNVMVLTRDDDYYVFCYHDDQWQEILKQLRLFAGNPDLNFTWNDAASVANDVCKHFLGDDEKENER